MTVPSMERAPVSSLRGLPSLPGWPGLGQLLAFRRDPLAVLRRLASLPGPLWQLRLGRRRVVVASSPEVAEALLVRLAPALEKGPLVRRWSRPLLGEGLISASTDVHADHRAQLAPVLAWLRGDAWTRRLSELCAQAVASLPPRIDLAQTAAAVVPAVLGPALVRGGTAWPPVIEAIERVNRHLVDRIRNPLLPSIGGAWRSLRSLERAIDGLLQGPERGEGAGDDLIGHLRAIRSAEGVPLTRRRIRDELVTLLVAALETTTTALTWTLALLATHPEICQRLRAEVIGVVGPSGPPGAAHLPALVFCEQVIKESLRLWPPVHTLGRQVRSPVTLMGTSLPAGTVVAFSTYLLHRRPELYPDPDSFQPQRFAGGSPGRFAYLPFGAGPRACLGGEPALSTLKLLLAGIVARHQLPPVATPTPELLVTLRPRFSRRR